METALLTDCILQRLNSGSLDNFCRTCLTNEELRLIDEQLIDMLRSFLTLHVDFEGDVPLHACLQCIYNIVSTYNFKQQVEVCDSIFRKYLCDYDHNFTPIIIKKENYEDSSLNEHLDVHDSYRNLRRRCLTCLNDRDEAISVIDNSVKDMLVTLTSINLNNLSYICNQCTANVTRSYNFKEQVEYCNSALKKYLMGSENNKEETEVIVADIKEEIDDIDLNLNENTLDIEESSCNDEDAFRDNTSATQGKFTCDICVFVCDKQSALKKHKRGHEKVLEHTCSECGEFFYNKNTLRGHMKTHIKVDPSEEKKRDCKMCGKRFSNSGDLLVHMRGHTGERPLECDTCGKSFADPRNLKRHLKIHTGERNHVCDVCHKNFIRMCDLKRHIMIHTGEKPFTCSFCNHAFNTRSNLITHEMIHSGEWKYECEICGKKARSTTDLNSHMYTHTGEKPLKCKMSECDQQFRTHSKRSAHMQTHTGEKHKCDTCNKTFTDSWNLKRHINTHKADLNSE